MTGLPRLIDHRALLVESERGKNDGVREKEILIVFLSLMFVFVIFE